MLKFYFLNFDYIGNDSIYRFYIVYKSVSLDNETITIVYNFTENPISERITNDTTNSIIKRSEQVALNKKVCSNILPSLPPIKTNRQIFACSFYFDVAERGFERVGSRLANDAIYNNKSKPTKQPMKRLFATPA